MQKVVHLLRSKRFIEHRKHQSLLITLLTILVMLFNQQVYSQDLSAKKVTLNLHNASVKDALMAVQKQSGITFVFSEDIKKYASSKITLTQKDTSVKQAIELILKTTNLKYTQMEDQVVIDEKPAPKSPNAAAGQGPGTIKGRIVEFETSQPLPGASVYIVELQKGMQSNNEGYYKFNNIPAGKYTLKVSYVSFTSETVQVEAKADKEETFDIKMRGSNSLTEVVVSGTRKTRAPVSHTTERQLVGELKAAQSVVSGISSEQISKSADRNAAEVVRKIAGVTIRDDKFIIIRGMNERYNLTYLNGNIAPSTELYSRAFSLDLIPSRIIDRILVYKSPAPDLSADMTGGAVKIFTKDAKNVKHFDLEFQTGYKENTTFNKNFLIYNGGKFDFLGFDDGTRKLPSVVPHFGDFTKANISQSAYSGAFSNILNYGKQTATPPIQLTANYYNSFKLAGKALSMLTSFSYKNEPLHTDVDRSSGNVTYYDPEITLPRGTTLSKMGTESQNTQTAQLSLLQNFTYHLRDSSSLYFKNFLLQQGQSATILRNTATNQIYKNDEWQDLYTNSTQGKDLRDIILSYQQRSLYSGNFGGDHYFGKQGKQNLQWNGGYTYSRLSIPDQRAIHLQNLQVAPQGLTTAGDHEQNWVPVFRDQDANNLSYNNLEQGMISRVWIQNTEQVYNGSVDYTYKFKPWMTLKAGTYNQWKQRVVYRRVFTVNEGDLNSSGYPDPYNPGIGGEHPVDYNSVFFHQQDLDQVWSTKYLRDDGRGLKVFDRTNGSDAYIATEQNNSGYIAASLLPFNAKLDIYGGLRVEYNRQKVAGALSPANLSSGIAGGVGSQGVGSANLPVLTDLKATSFLPSLNIGYRPNNSWVLRASYGKTVNRPELRELSPYNEADYLNNQSISGNINLVSATVDNYDMRAEWYPHGNAKGETISLGFFDKQINHPIERVIYNALFLASTASNISFLNADKATVRGIELDVRKNLDFLPGNFFRNLSIIANGTYIYSKATRTQKDSTLDNPLSGDVNVSRQLQGQAPYSVNAGLYYDNSGSGTKIALIFNQVGPRIYAASIGSPTRVGNADGSISPSAGNQGSLIELTRKQLDFSLTQRVIKSLQVKLSVQNLLNSSVQMVEDANFTYKYEKAHIIAPQQPGTYGATWAGDLLASDYKPGRFFLLTFTYGF